MRWSKNQLETLHTLHEKYKNSARSATELATIIGKELPTRTKGGILTKLNRKYGDKTVKELVKKIRLLPIKERQDLLATVDMFVSPPKQQTLKRVAPYDLPSPVIQRVSKETIKKNTQPAILTPAKETRKRRLQVSPPPAADKDLTKFYKRLEKLYKSPSPPKKKPKRKTKEDQLKQRFQKLGFRPHKHADTIPDYQMDIYEQLNQSETQAKKRQERDFENKFFQAFHIKPKDLVVLVKNPTTTALGKRKTRTDTVKEQPILDQLTVFYQRLDKDNTNMDVEINTFLRQKLAEHETSMEKKEKQQLYKQAEKLRQKHLKERLATLKNMTMKELNEWQKTFKKEIKDKQQMKRERERILELEVSPNVKKTMLDMLDWPKVPKYAFGKKTKSKQDDSDSDSDENDDDNDDGDVGIPTKKKTRTLVAS